MTRAEYMLRFTQKLGNLPDGRKQEIIEDIMAHFAEGAEAGIGEETLAEGLGQPETLAKEYRATFATEVAKKKPSVGNVLRAVWAGIGMGMLNLIFVLPIVLVIFAVWLSLLITAVAMGISGALAAVLTLVHIIIPLSFVAVAYPALTVFAGIAIAALGALLFIGVLYAGRFLGKAIVRYVQANIEIIAGRRKQNAQGN
jgi:uncharacterized membrane protein